MKLLWYVDGTHQKTPSTYKIDYEDLDANSYRSKATGDLIDSVISQNWCKLYFTYNYLTESEVNSLFKITSKNPINVKAINPMFDNGYIEAQFRCSKKSVEMLQDGNYKMSFNLVQKKKVKGQ